MTNKWPQFITRDLGDSDADRAEMDRRWRAYDRDMRALIAKGGLHQDDDGWWVETATGTLVGPDPDIERPLSDTDLARLRPMEQVAPELATRARGRPKSDNPKQPVTIRLDADLVETLRATGKGWQSRVNDMLRTAMDL
ncbi:BrnA antitoxin family protein [Jannaschia sp. M317]|uniref:BrnA antitoxin family protein n=1 Tax=Jannaschia sp. M317 TaxID=2867011 RepID=UPI0021A3C4A0|nr:BrnA antitoxin family protein [Jannaschia sp. M317]UWQ16140.1 BrnA antitoxin family protein [Jannaschia sp. M317]